MTKGDEGGDPQRLGTLVTEKKDVLPVRRNSKKGSDTLLQQCREKIAIGEAEGCRDERTHL